MKQLFRWLGLGFVFLLGVALAINALSYANFDPDYSFLRLKQEAVATGWYLPAYYSHVLAGGIILVLGFLQFSRRLRRKYPRLHRVVGKAYILLILFFSAPGGLVMSFFIGRGPVVWLSFLLQCALWFYFTGQGYTWARKGNFQRHEQEMWRSFALTLAAITLRVYIFLVSSFVPLDNPTAYGLLAWLSWVPNLVLAEVLLRRNRTIP